MAECLEDCCEVTLVNPQGRNPADLLMFQNCPEAINDEEKEIQEEDDKSYIRGRVAYVEKIMVQISTHFYS